MHPMDNERFWSHVDKSGDCWVWIGAKHYAKTRVGSSTQGSHRASWEMANGPIPKGLYVLHRCDNPPCVRPDHLFLGTARDNLEDARSKGHRPMPEDVVKRRLIWFTDGEWDRLNAEARRSGLNISNLVRERVLAAAPVKVDSFGTSRPAPKPARGKR